MRWLLGQSSFPPPASLPRSAASRPRSSVGVLSPPPHLPVPSRSPQSHLARSLTEIPGGQTARLRMFKETPWLYGKDSEVLMKRIFRLTLIFSLPYFIFVFYLVLRGPAGTRTLPHWAWGAAFFYFVASFIAVGYWGRGPKPDELVPDPKIKARSMVRTTRSLQIGLVLYVVILLNGLRLVLQRTVPLPYAIPGLIVDLFLIAVFWWLRARGKHHSDNSHDLG